MEQRPFSAKAIFEQALEFESDAARAAYLDQTCADDGDLRQRVEDLLVAYQQAGSFLEAGPDGMVPTVNQPLTERPGTIIGRYKLLEQRAPPPLPVIQGRPS